MAQPSPHISSSKTETDIAVLQVQFANINEKVDDVKAGLKDLREHMDDHMNQTREMILDNQKTNVKSHNEMSDKINALEKWRWMLMGAGILAGALGWPVVEKLLGM